MPTIPALPDTHIHVIPQAYRAALEKKGDLSGWAIPEYSLALLKAFLTSLNITHPILSGTSPGPPVLGPTEAGRTLARQLNEEVAKEVDALVADGFNAGFFASLPDFNDVQGAIEEISWVFETQKKATGVIVLTNYGDKLMADPSFRPIWNKLNEVRALVFVHPTNFPIKPHLVAGALPQPAIDYPHATTRAATELIISRTFRACPNIDVILSHAGGTLPFIAPRILGLLDFLPANENIKVSRAEALEDMSRFHYDLALSTSPAQLSALLLHTDGSKISFGTDFPYAPSDVIYADVQSYAKFVKESPNGQDIRPEVLLANVKRLVERHPVEKSVMFKTTAGSTGNVTELTESAKKARTALAEL